MRAVLRISSEDSISKTTNLSLLMLNKVDVGVDERLFLKCLGVEEREMRCVCRVVY